MIRLNNEILEEIAMFCDKTDMESVGVVLIDGGVQRFVPFQNVSDNQVVHYIAEPQMFHDVLKDTTLFGGEQEIVCFVHSHPSGCCLPSGTDIHHAYHNYPYLIYWREGFTVFMVNEEGVKVEELK